MTYEDRQTSAIAGDGSLTVVRQSRWTPAVIGTLGFVMFVHLLPRLWLGEGSIITIHDNLDSDFGYRVLIAAPGRMWNYHAQIPELLGGLPRSVYPSPTKLGSILFWLLPPFWAYVALDLAVHAIGFLGMHALLRDHLSGRASRGHLLLIAASFALLPFYVIYDASVAAQPMVVWALLCMWKRQHIRASLGALFSFGFMSVLPTSGAFVVAGAALVVGVAMIRARRFERFAVLGLGALVVGCVLSDLWFIRVMLNPPYVTHRSAWFAENSIQVLTLKGMLARATHTFLIGRYHSASLHTMILMLTLATAGVQFLRRQWKQSFSLLAIVGFSYLLALSDPLGSWQGLRPLWSICPFLRTVHVRFHWFLPTLWFSVLAFLVSLWSTPRDIRVGRVRLSPRLISRGVTLVLLANLAVVVLAKGDAQGELTANYRKIVAQLRGKRSSAVSFGEFCARNLFADIERYIGKPKSSYRVVSIGLHPNVAMLNGFQTADGYHDNYPLAYKRRFEALIAPELARDSFQREYFEGWGSRAYVLFAHQNRSLLDERQADRAAERRRIQLEPRAFSDLQISYVFSAIKLLDPLQSGLQYQKAFMDPKAAWRVYLYKVVPLSAL